MGAMQSIWAGEGLERSCGPREWVRRWEAADGVERLAAWFAGRAYARHRHDAYAVCLTESGAQCFDYRGAAEVSTPGEVVVLHPDEPHDGRAGDARGFGYRIVYVAPARIAEAARAICGRAAPLPFVRRAVSRNPLLADAVRAAFALPPEPVAVEDFIVRLAEGLLAADPSVRNAVKPPRIDRPALERARRFLEAEMRRAVRASELEAVTGLGRYELARQFRAAFGTSPYRYLTMRRLDHARRLMRESRALAEVALGAGFADQAHFTRAFKAAYGLTPGRYARLVRAD